MHEIIIDESQFVFDAGIQYRQTSVEMGQPTISLFHTQFRDFGEGLILTSQMPSQILHTVHANTLIKLTGNLGDASDISFMSDSLGLTEEQAKLIHKLKRGQWLTKINDRYTEPFLLQTEDHPASRIKDVSDGEVEARLREKLPQLFVVPEPPRIVVDDSLSTDAMNLLLSAGKEPKRILRHHLKVLGISARKIENAKKELLQRELVTEALVKVGNYPPVLYLIPTEKAIGMMKDVADITLLKKIGNVGIAHLVYQDFVAEAYALAGYHVFVEHTVGDRRYDVYAVAGGRKVGVEVEVTTENLREKIEKSEVDELVFVFKDKESLERMRATVSPLEPSLLEKVRFRVIADYVKIVREKIGMERRRKDPDSKSGQDSDSSAEQDRNKKDDQP